MNANLISKDDLIAHFKDLGVRKGMLIYVQSKMEYYSYLCGGNRVLIEALQEVVGYEGTIVTNSFTLDNLDPLDCNAKQFEPYQIEVVREALPPFHKKLNVSDNELANQMMLFDGVYRSNHPTRSFVAWGKYAKLICDRQPLHFALAKDSPLDKLSGLNGFVLLLGEKYDHADIFLHALHKSAIMPIKITHAPLERSGKRSFLAMLDYMQKPLHLEAIVEMMKQRQIINETYIGRARCRMFNAKEAVLLASGFFYTHTDEEI